MGGVLAAYLTTLGIVTYRWATGPKQAPPPIAFAAAGGLFALAGIAGKADPKLGNALAWAITAGAVFAPRSKIHPVAQAFGPSSIAGPFYHSRGDSRTPQPKKGQAYYKWDAKLHRYVIVDSNGNRLPGYSTFPTPPIGLFPAYPGQKVSHE